MTNGFLVAFRAHFGEVLSSRSRPASRDLSLQWADSDTRNIGPRTEGAVFTTSVQPSLLIVRLSNQVERDGDIRAYRNLPYWRAVTTVAAWIGCTE